MPCSHRIISSYIAKKTKKKHVIFSNLQIILSNNILLYFQMRFSKVSILSVNPPSPVLRKARACPLKLAELLLIFLHDVDHLPVRRSPCFTSAAFSITSGRRTRNATSKCKTGENGGNFSHKRFSQPYLILEPTVVVLLQSKA